jgi:hypothetical protein
MAISTTTNLCWIPATDEPATQANGILTMSPETPSSFSMTPIPPPHEDHPDRFLRCQEALEDLLLAAVEHAVGVGWTSEEVAAALVELADNHMLSVLANRDLAHELASFRK